MAIGPLHCIVLKPLGFLLIHYEPQLWQFQLRFGSISTLFSSSSILMMKGSGGTACAKTKRFWMGGFLDYKLEIIFKTLCHFEAYYPRCDMQHCKIRMQWFTLNLKKSSSRHVSGNWHACMWREHSLSCRMYSCYVQFFQFLFFNMMLFCRKKLLRNGRGTRKKCCSTTFLCWRVALQYAWYTFLNTKFPAQCQLLWFRLVRNTLEYLCQQRKQTTKWLYRARWISSWQYAGVATAASW